MCNVPCEVCGDVDDCDFYKSLKIIKESGEEVHESKEVLS